MTKNERDLLQLAEDLRGEIKRVKQIEAKQAVLIAAQKDLIKTLKRQRTHSQRASQHKD